MEPISQQEKVHALKKSRGYCQVCKVGAGSLVRLRRDGSWVRFAFSIGRWLDPKGQEVGAHLIAGLKDQTIALEVVRTPETTPRTMHSGRVLALCQFCRIGSGRPDPPTHPENLELGL